MFSGTYFKYFFPFITIGIWYIVFQKYEIPWSTILFCPPIMYIIYKLLDFSSEDNTQEIDKSHHKDYISQEDTECINSSATSEKGINKEELIQDVSAISQFIHEFIPHAKHLYLTIFRPKKVQETEQAKADTTADGEPEVTNETEATEANSTDTTEVNTATPSNPQFQKTEMAMNLFKRIYIAFTQGKVLRPTDTPLQRLCWAVFSNKDEFINFIDVVSDSKKEDTDSAQQTDSNANEIKIDEIETPNSETSDSEANDTKGATTIATEPKAIPAEDVPTETAQDTGAVTAVEVTPIEKTAPFEAAPTSMTSVANNSATINFATKDTSETETVRTSPTTTAVEPNTISSTSNSNTLKNKIEDQNSLTAEFNKQAYFLWGFIQAEYIDYDLSLITEYPYIRILFANQLLIELTQESLSNQPVYKLKIYQAESQCISIEIDNMQKVKLYNSVIKFVLNNHLLKV